MMIVHLYDNNKARKMALEDFIYANIDTAIVFDNDWRCVGKNGLHIFLTNKEYETWCKGRTYVIDGKPYHSGYEIKADCEVNDERSRQDCSGRRTICGMPCMRKSI